MDKQTKREIQEINTKINAGQNRLKKCEEYVKVLQAIVPLVHLANDYACWLDLDAGQAKKIWRTILADVETIQDEARDAYSDTADIVYELTNKLNEIKKEQNETA